MSFNPFHGIIENEFYPHAFTLRTTLWEKLKKTYRVFSGETNLEPNRGYGLFDYFTLFAPTLLLLAFTAINHSFLPQTPEEDDDDPIFGEGYHDNSIFSYFPNNIIGSTLRGVYIGLAVCLTVPILVAQAALTVARHTIGIVLTIISSPIVAAVHVVSSLFASPIKNKAAEMTVAGEKLPSYMMRNQVSHTELAADYCHRGQKVISSMETKIEKPSSGASALGSFINYFVGNKTESPMQVSPVTTKVTSVIEAKLYIGPKVNSFSPCPNRCLPKGENDHFSKSELDIAKEHGSFEAEGNPDAVEALFKLNIGGLSSRYGLFDTNKHMKRKVIEEIKEEKKQRYG